MVPYWIMNSKKEQLECEKMTEKVGMNDCLLCF